MMLGVLLLLNFINAFIIFSFMDMMYERVYSNKIFYIAAFIIFVVLHATVNSYRIMIVNILFTIVIIQVLGKLMYEDIPQKSVYNLLFALYLIFIDTAAFAAVSFILALPLQYLIFSKYYVSISAAIQYTVVFCTYKILIQHFLKDQTEPIRLRQNIYFVLLAAFEIGIICYTWNIKTQIGMMFLLIFCLGFIAMDIYLVYLFGIVRKHEVLQHEINLTKQQNMLFEQHITTKRKGHEESRKTIHDLRGQMNILGSLYAQNGAPASAKNLKEQIENALNTLGDEFRCNDPIMNVIINECKTAAKAQGIKTVFIIQADIDWSFMWELHMTSLLPNLLNNAMEACAQMTTGEKFIDCRIRKINQMIVMRVQNSYCPACLVLKEGKYNSTKEGHFGIGLSNVRDIAERYNGRIDISTKDAIFTVAIFLSAFSAKEAQTET